MAQTIQTTLSDIYRLTALGDPSTAVGVTLFGINHRRTPMAVPINRDDHGLTFFTRPQLNLTDDNASALRQMVPLLTTADVSIQRMVRKLLDPRIDLPSAIVDDQMVFMPMLTNLLLSCTGWPDPSLDVHHTKPGVRKEVQSIVDSVTDQYGEFNLQTSFRNMEGDPVLLLFKMWQDYMSAVFTDELMPYPDFIAMNEIDYNTRVYRLVLDRNRRIVQKIACCGAAFPLNVPFGAAIDYTHEHPINANNHEVQIRFECNGYRYNDHIIVRDFNAAVGIFNPGMRDNPAAKMIQIPQELLSLFNSRGYGYPYIEPDTLELQWFATPDQYNTVTLGYQRTIEALGGQVNNSFSPAD
jgi:hypothetical protein